MPTYRLDLEYEGTRFRGWQIQKNARTVAGELSRAIELAGGALVELAGSGRTDAGVHALCQTAHLRLREPVRSAELRDKVNATLPHDIHLLSLRAADPSFHARHSAISRSYLYQVALRRSGLYKRFVWWIEEPLDAERMASAAERLVGLHDFARFCERPAEQSSTLVKVEQALVERKGDLLLVRLVASHFLWKMVRRVVGALVRVGAGALTVERLTELVTEKGGPDRGERPAQWTAPAAGLFLERVVYPGEEPLAPLASVTPLSAAADLERRTLFVGKSGKGVKRQS